MKGIWQWNDWQGNGKNGADGAKAGGTDPCRRVGGSATGGWKPARTRTLESVRNGAVGVAMRDALFPKFFDV